MSQLNRRRGKHGVVWLPAPFYLDASRRRIKVLGYSTDAAPAVKDFVNRNAQGEGPK
jgi:hypothetical protein